MELSDRRDLRWAIMRTNIQNSYRLISDKVGSY